MILSVCRKWSLYFNDEYHRIKPLDELISEAESWFMYYTLMKYDINGPATYNKFITDHVNQRVRYLYECELKYYKHNIFPDPDKRSDDNIDMFEEVVYNYTSEHESLEDSVIDSIDGDSREKLAHEILLLLNNESVFNNREKKIFTDIVYNGVTHDQVGKDLGVSRARVSQILQKVKVKLYKQMEGSQAVWGLIGDTNIEFKER